jgi:hypothetical protein
MTKRDDLDVHRKHEHHTTKTTEPEPGLQVAGLEKVLYYYYSTTDRRTITMEKMNSPVCATVQYNLHSTMTIGHKGMANGTYSRGGTSY